MRATGNESKKLKEAEAEAAQDNWVVEIEREEAGKPRRLIPLRRPLRIDELTQGQIDNVFLFHAATGGDLTYYNDGSVDAR